MVYINFDENGNFVGMSRGKVDGWMPYEKIEDDFTLLRFDGKKIVYDIAKKTKKVKEQRLATLEKLIQNSYLFIKKIAMKKPFLKNESAINEQYNSYNTMYANAIKGLFDKATNNSIIQAHEEAEQRVASINLLINNIRAKLEHMIENNIDEVDELLSEAMQDEINVEDDFTISDSEIERLKSKYGG